MTTLREAAQAALDALDDLDGRYLEIGSRIYLTREIKALEAALYAESAQPVAWRYQDARGNFRYRGYKAGFDVDYPSLKPVPLYLSPQPPADVPLMTVQEMQDVIEKAIIDWGNSFGSTEDVFIARAVEAEVRRRCGVSA